MSDYATSNFHCDLALTAAAYLLSSRCGVAMMDQSAALGTALPQIWPNSLRLAAPRRANFEYARALYKMLVLWDAVVTAACGALALSLMARTTVMPSPHSQLGSTILLGAIVAPFFTRTRSSTIVQPGKDVRGSILSNAVWQAALAALFLYALGAQGPIPLELRMRWAALWSISAFTSILAGRVLLERYVRFLCRRGMLVDRVAIFGSSNQAGRLISLLRDANEQPIEVVGIFDERRGRIPVDGPLPVGTLDDLLELGRKGELDWVIVAIPASAEQRVNDLIHRLKAMDVNIALCPQDLFGGVPLGSIQYIANIPVPVLADRPLDLSSRAIKRAIDIIISSVLLLFSSPFLSIIAILVKSESPGPAFFKQQRHGWNNEVFSIYKIRTMRSASSATESVRQTSRQDLRITRLGRFLRRTSIDELPQLINVLKGDMSLIGPRPHATWMRTEERLCHEIIASYSHRHRVRPGITGWAQVNGYRGAIDAADALKKRVEFDLYYINNWSLLLDIKIFLLTIARLPFDGNAY